jgi:N-methylhydantoinase A
VTYRISVDTGGTFTDVVVADEDGHLHVAKALTTYDRGFSAVAEALGQLVPELGSSMGEILARSSQFTYGTTRATNAIVERKTARAALLVTAGFPDVLLLREGGKIGPFTQQEYEPAYVPRYLTFEIEERIDAEGGILVPLDEASVVAAARACAGHEVEAVAVCLLWSTVNGSHELRVGELLAEHLPGVPVTLSHRLNPVLREYRRASSAAIDASLKPLMQAFLRELDDDLRTAGFQGNVLVSTSFGGSWPTEQVVARPIYSVGSGPAMAPVAAVAYGSREPEGGNGLLVCDTGGTTFDVSLVSDGSIHYSDETWLGGKWTGHITGTRAVDVSSIGAGGGSIIWLDEGGLLHVGPRSAGADPGPACYGRGGTQPTITDAALVLGFLDPHSFLGGRLVLDRQAAEAALAPLADELALDVRALARGAFPIMTQNLVTAIRAITVAQGIDPRDLTIFAGGGASGLNCVQVGRELGCRRVLMPRTAGALSACGGLFSDVISSFSVARYGETRALDLDAANDTLAAAAGQAELFLAEVAGLGPVATSLDAFVDARYPKQVWELETPLAASRLGEADVRELEQAFHGLHERVYAVSEPGQYLECLTWKIRATAKLPKPELVEAKPPGGVPVPLRRQPVTFAEAAAAVETPIFAGEDLAAG